MIEYLTSLQLFLIPLDTQHVWYRYHHLFADVLRERARSLFPSQIPQWHRRAVDWYESQGLRRDAIRHMIRAGFYEDATRFVDEESESLVFSGEITTLISRVGDIPRNYVLACSHLCAVTSISFAIMGDIPTALEWITLLEFRSKDCPFTPVEEADEPSNNQSLNHTSDWGKQLLSLI
jgi:LuxR family maltose regulon positive regulatory protein